MGVVDHDQGAEPLRPFHDPRQRRVDKAFPVGQARSRLEAKLLGRAQHLGNPDGFRPKPMPDLLGTVCRALGIDHGIVLSFT